jgi:hypothetical protein
MAAMRSLASIHRPSAQEMDSDAVGDRADSGPVLASGSIPDPQGAPGTGARVPSASQQGYQEQAAAFVAEVQTGPAGATGARIPLTSQLVERILLPGDVPGAPKPFPPGRQYLTGTAFVAGAGDGGEVAIDDVSQGGLANCYFMALLAAIARVRPDLIRDMISENSDGTYTVHFRALPSECATSADVVVDKEFWMRADSQTPAFAEFGDVGKSGPELWPMLIEKAFATACGSYRKIEASKQDTDVAYEAMTGAEPTYIHIDEVAEATILPAIRAHFKQGKPVNFFARSKGLDRAAGVIGDHAYALKDLQGDTLSLYNPWRFRHLDSVDVAMLKKNFAHVLLINT